MRVISDCYYDRKKTPYPELRHVRIVPLPATWHSPALVVICFLQLLRKIELFCHNESYNFDIMLIFRIEIKYIALEVFTRNS